MPQEDPQDMPPVYTPQINPKALDPMPLVAISLCIGTHLIHLDPKLEQGFQSSAGKENANMQKINYTNYGPITLFDWAFNPLNKELIKLAEPVITTREKHFAIG